MFWGDIILTVIAYVKRFARSLQQNFMIIVPNYAALYIYIILPLVDSASFFQIWINTLVYQVSLGVKTIYYWITFVKLVYFEIFMTHDNALRETLLSMAFVKFM